MSKTRLVVGCMSGTSMDGIDCALVRIEGEGLAMKAGFVRGHSYSSQPLTRLLRPVAMQKRITAGQIGRYALMVGMSHMIAIKELLAGERADLIAVHGQTIYHEARVSWQLLNPWPILAEHKTPVVFDLRGADIAAGGEGAPITPLADHILFREPRKMQVVVNLGGFANFTWLPPTRSKGDAALRSIRGGDICVCNQLLDAVARLTLKKKYDEGGETALGGSVDEDALEFLSMILGAQADGGRSLGTGDEAIDWARTFRHQCSPADLARTACAAIGRTIAATVGEADRMILAGGGAMNAALVEEISGGFEGDVIRSDELGVPMQYREAIEMAVLGALAEDNVPITLQQVTNHLERPHRAGCWIYPG